MYRVFLAGASSEHERITRIAQALWSTNLVELPFPWWLTASTWSGRDEERSLDEQRGIAAEAMWSLCRSHCFWLIMPQQPTRGAWFELGMAVRLRPAVRVIVSGPGSSSSIYTSQADFRDDSCDVGMFEVMRHACAHSHRPASEVAQ